MGAGRAQSTSNRQSPCQDYGSFVSGRPQEADAAGYLTCGLSSSVTVSLAPLWKLTWLPTTIPAEECMVTRSHRRAILGPQALPRRFGKLYKSLIGRTHYFRYPSLAGSDPSRHQRLLVAHSPSPRVPSAGEEQLPVHLIPIDSPSLI